MPNIAWKLTINETKTQTKVLTSGH
uniref:Uncharacterized protein n=1 Tax=Arundo donax TaxID=35708 RepID=A0A0A9BRG3_ARUDO